MEPVTPSKLDSKRSKTKNLVDFNQSSDRYDLENFTLVIQC